MERGDFECPICHEGGRWYWPDFMGHDELAYGIGNIWLGDDEWMEAMKEYNENTLRNVSTRRPSDYHPTSDDSAGSQKSSKSQKMKRKSPQDRYVSNITREVKILTADISEVKAQQADMIKSESNLQSTLKSKFSSLNESKRDTTSTQKRDMKDLKTKNDDQVDQVTKKLEERAASQRKEISNLESSISSTIEEIAGQTIPTPRFANYQTR